MVVAVVTTGLFRMVLFSGLNMFLPFRVLLSLPELSSLLILMSNSSNIIITNTTRIVMSRLGFNTPSLEPTLPSGPRNVSIFYRGCTNKFAMVFFTQLLFKSSNV